MWAGVAQTVDTHFNQAAKARYQSLEVAALIRLMRDGVAVPQLTRMYCVDLMAEVLSGMSLHRVVADGNVKTGLRVSLDDFLAGPLHRQGGRDFLGEGGGARHAQESELRSCAGQRGGEAGKDELVL